MKGEDEMSICEDRITEDSTEFEKAFLKIYDGNLWTALDKMKYWQQPKPLVVVPQIVADFIEESKESLKLYGAFHEIDESYGTGTELYDWLFASVDSQELFARAWLDGYTVEKEKKYILKHIDLSELSSDDSLYLGHGIYKPLLHIRYSKDDDMSKIEQCHFTQSEIDKLNVGSYEQIEVKVEEVEK